MIFLEAFTIAHNKKPLCVKAAFKVKINLESVISVQPDFLVTLQY
jgi:hypothetical protein